MHLDGDDLLAELKAADPDLYERCVLRLTVKILQADLATERAEVDRLRGELERGQQGEPLPARPVGTAPPFTPMYPLTEGERRD